MKKNILRKIILICIFILMILGINKEVKAYDVKIYGKKGVECGEHDNCWIYTGIHNTGDGIVHAGPQMIGEVGVGKSFGVFCIEHSNENNGYEKMETIFKIVIRNRKFSLYKYDNEDGEITPIFEEIIYKKAAKMAFILARSGEYSADIPVWKKEDRSGHNYSYVQFALWSRRANSSSFDYVDTPDTFNREFFSGVLDLLNKNYSDANRLKVTKSIIGAYANNPSEHNIYESTMYNANTNPDYKTPWKINKNATEYMEKLSGYSEPKNKTDSNDVKTNGTNKNIVGPFKIKFQEIDDVMEICEDKFELLDADGNVISSSYWDIGTYKDGKFTKNNSITSEKNFYIRVDKNILQTRGLSRLRVCYKIFVAQTEAYILRNGSGTQANLFVGYASTDWEDNYISIPIDIGEVTVSLNITKANAITEQNIAGVKLKVYGIVNSTTKGWVKSDGTLTSSYESGNTWTTGSNGSIEISRLQRGKYYIYEIGTPDNYYLEDQRVTYPDDNDTTNRFAGKADYGNCVYLGNATCEEATNSVSFKQNPAAKLTIIKLDEKSKKKLNGFKFSIFMADDGVNSSSTGWLGYDANKKEVTYGNSWKDSKEFLTGNSYCGITSADGTINLDNLKYGRYYVFEVGVGTENSDVYSLKSQVGYKSTSDWSMLTESKWKITDKDTGAARASVLNGRSSHEAGYTSVTAADGKKYYFYRTKNAEGEKTDPCNYVRLDRYKRYLAKGDKVYYGTNHATYTIKNRKDGVIKIQKIDRKTSNGVGNVKIKIYAKLEDNSKGWLKTNGTLESNASSGSTWTTGSDGTITINKLQAGRYYIYEIATASGYNLEDQRENYTDDKDPNKFAGTKSYEDYVYLGYKDSNYDDQTSTPVQKYQYKSAKLTIKKVGSDGSTKLNGVKFAIYRISDDGKSDGWLGYSSSQVTYGNTWANAYKFETGKSYCGVGTSAGQFTLNNLRHGNYYVVEVDIGNNTEYSLKAQVGYRSNSNYGFLKAGHEMNVESVLNGEDSHKSEFTIVTKADGTRYGFKRYKGAEDYCNYIHLDYYDSSVTSSDGTVYYGTNNATYTIKNRKDATLTINKIDRNTSVGLGGVKLKIYGILADGSKGWVTANGTLSSTYQGGYTFTTDSSGSVTVRHLLEGRYYIYEIGAAPGYNLEDQRANRPDSDDPNRFAGKADYGNCVYLGDKYCNYDQDPEPLPKYQYQPAKLTVRKVDYDNQNIRLNNFQFAIFMEAEDGTSGSGWLGYNGSAVTFGNSWQNAYRFTTGQSYCGEQAVTGEFTLNTLRHGNYYVFEVGTSSPYTLSGQVAYTSSSDYNVLSSSDDWKMTGTPSVLNGLTSYRSGFTTVTKADGTTYNFVRSSISTGGCQYIHLDYYANSVVNSEGITYYGTNHAIYTIKNRKNTKITLNKTDQDTGEKVANVGVKILARIAENVNYNGTPYASGTWGWLKSNGSITTNVNEAYEFKTNSNGIVEVNNIPYGTYYMYEVTPGAEYYLEDQINYNVGIPGGYSGTFLSGGYVYLGETTVTSEDNTREVTAYASNRKGELNITKIDGTYHTDLGLNEYVYLPNAQIKIYGTNLRGGTVGWLKQVETGDGRYRYEYTTYSEATTFTTNSYGMIELKGVRYGTYYIYEIGTPTGYNIKTQDGYHQAATGSSDIGNNIDWIYLGNTTVSQGINRTVNKVTDNDKYVDLKGKVWEDQKDTKANTYDSLYNAGSGDILKEGITVNLYNRRTAQRIATTTTNAQGEYEFNEQTVGRKLRYWELAYCYVEFIYDNTQYIVVNPFQNGNNAIPINSKAQPEQITQKELYDSNLTGTTGENPGRAITLKGSDNSLNYYKIVHENPNADIAQKLLTSYYNYSTYKIENINLGLVAKATTDHAIGQTIEYVKIVRGSYTFTYKYGETAVTEQGEPQTTVRFQNSKKSFGPEIYPSDIKYNIANGYDGNNPNAFKVYVVYKIDVQNLTTTNNPDIYVEKQLHLTNLTNMYDKDRFRISHDRLDGDDENIAKDFGLWEDASGSGTATFNITASDKKYKAGSSGLSPQEIESTYIQFKVTDEALIKLVTEEQLAESPTVARSSGYHIYTRNDKNWKDNNTYTHQTINEQRENGSLYLSWKLHDTRTISGTVFEDTRTQESANENTRLGDGKYDSSSEKTVSGVAVSLVNQDGSQANVYNGDVTYDSSTGRWTTPSQPAGVEVNADGTYSIPGVVPGEYYLRFTYGDGSVGIQKLDGTWISNVKTQIESQSIESNNYKSTILTGAAKDPSDEKTWFLQSIAEGSYSIAYDVNGYKYDHEDIGTPMNVIERARIDASNIKEINHTSSKDRVTINAVSPNMDINFEYVPDKEAAFNDSSLRTNCTGMNFGIIERAHVNITLEKIITNVKLTLSNGSTIVNGDPRSSNVSTYLIRLNDSYSKIEMDNSYLYGSNLSITYSLIATNESELDYATENYYVKGDKGGATPVTTTVTKIIDYLSDEQAKYIENSSNISLEQIYTNEGFEKEDYFETGLDNSNYKDQLVITSEEELTPQSAGTGNSSSTYTLTVTKLLSNSDEDMGLNSYDEIIGIKNITFTPQYISHSGNYKAADSVPYPTGTSEPDNAESTFAVTPSTGENRSYTIYIVTTVMLVVIAGGVTLIKKFVLKNK